MDTPSEPRLLLPRRAFLQGLISACAAPAIITSSGFRAGLFLPRCHERWLVYYNICDDTFHCRADFAKHELVRPPHVQVVPPHLVARIKEAARHVIDGCIDRALRPGLQQHCFDWKMTAMRCGPMHESNVELSIEKALRPLLEVSPGTGTGTGGGGGGGVAPRRS